MRIETMRLSLILILLPAVTGSLKDLVRSIFQSGRIDVDKKGITYPVLYSGIRNQPRIPDYIPFPCNVKFGRSPTTPDNVHRLRPGDIDVIGSLGDSLVAGSGALEDYAIGTFIEARGVSWCIGGQGDWRQFLTLPNLLKVFNPNLIGYSTGTGEFISTNAKLNIAFPVAATEDAFQQARILVQRIKSNPKINVKKQWKLITIFFGANDICSAQCFNPEHFSPLRYAHHLRRTLDYLKFVLPRTLVNVVPAIDVTVSVRIPRSPICRILHTFYCACLHKGNRPDIEASKMSHLYQQAIEALIYSGRYDKSSDFTVVLQPFSKLFNAPNADPRRAQSIDPSLITYDCFHFSQKGHALGANLLWNNMLEPVGNKTERGLPQVFERLLCPSEKAPYIFTNVNSRRFRLTGRQDGIMAR
ncbi:phospholipase B1, membrane-associated-like [Apis florea]|uniref:phospholipase B1, membrane-associated-like n=1 Tax=Apis florea TaxID=7463 RepID=UPI000252B47A|nr:phospholipase B1, membrane-associated-like [Apis florea]